MAENDVKQTSTNKVNNFLEKNRKVIIVVFIGIIACLIGFIVGVSLSSSQKKIFQELTKFLLH